MYNSACLRAGFVMQYIRGTGLWDEDHVNDYITTRYLTPRALLSWYQRMEKLQTCKTMCERRKLQTDNNNNGLHHSGKGAFERELERRGIAVDKYPLTTTTGATRVAELVQLRRQQMEKKAAELMAEQHASVHFASPSPTWYDERAGPLNPRFLQSMQWRYDNDITHLPETPYIPSETDKAELSETSVRSRTNISMERSNANI